MVAARGTRIGLLLATWTLISIAPTPAAESDLFNDGVCGPMGCVPLALCVDGYYCQATVCDPAFACSAVLDGRRSCAINVTIEGQTCSTTLATSGTIYLFESPWTNVPHTNLAVGPTTWDATVIVTHGEVKRKALANEWISNSADAQAAPAGQSTGRVRAYLYESNIDAEGHSFQQVLVSADRNGEGVWGKLILFDREVDECRFETNLAQAPVSECERTLP